MKCFLCDKPDDVLEDYLGSLSLCHDCGCEFCSGDKPGSSNCFSKHDCPALPKARRRSRLACGELGCNSESWHEGCPLHGKADGLPVYVLYNDNTSDYPGEWVVRRQEARSGRVLKDPELAARGSSREECVASLLKAHPHVGSMTCLDRQPGDDPVIAGTYL